MTDLNTPAGITAYLESTPYAASDVQTLSGGSSGFIYRVVLKTPLSTGETSVIVKHTLGHAASNTRLILKANRIEFEHEALQIITSIPELSTPESTVGVPRVLFYDPKTYTLAMSDLAPVRTLSAEIVACLERGDFDRIGQLGAALGEFMGRFHRWGSLPAQEGLRARFLENEASKEDVFGIRWRLMQMTATQFGMEREWMQEVADQGMRDAQSGGKVIAMADFWFDNMLVSESDSLRLYVVDWEMARCAQPELDVAHFATAAYSLVHVYPGLAPAGDGSFALMREFFKAYRVHCELDEIQMGINGARDTISFGVMMPWVRHRDNAVKEAIARVGLELLEAAHAGDTEALKRNPVICDLYR